MEDLAVILYDGYLKYSRDIKDKSSTISFMDFRLVCEFLNEVFEKLESR